MALLLPLAPALLKAPPTPASSDVAGPAAAVGLVALLAAPAMSNGGIEVDEEEDEDQDEDEASMSGGSFRRTPNVAPLLKVLPIALLPLLWLLPLVSSSGPSLLFFSATLASNSSS